MTSLAIDPTTLDTAMGESAGRAGRSWAAATGSARPAAAVATAFAVGAVCAAFVGCPGSGDGARRTRTAQVITVRTGVPEYDDFFATVHRVQVAINESERVRRGALGALVEALGLPEGSDLEACVAEIHTRAARLERSDTRIVIDLEAVAPAGDVGTRPSSDGGAGDGAAPSPPPGASSAGETARVAPATFPESQPQAERSVEVELRVEGAGTVPADLRGMPDALRRAVRAGLALKRRMDDITAFAPQIRAAGERLARTVATRAPRDARDLAAEFRDAIEFLDGVGPRARAQGWAGYRISSRVQAALIVAQAR